MCRSGRPRRGADRTRSEADAGVAIVGVAAAGAAAFVYAWVTVYSPIAGYSSILFVGLLAVGAVLPVAHAGRLLKVRRVVQMRIAGVATGVAALHLAWALQ